MKDYTGGGPGRARERKAPDKTTLERWYVREGMTEGQIAKRWVEETEYTIGRTGVHEALVREGLWKRKLPRYDDVLPWRVNSEHLMAWPARMLRLLARQRAGETLGDVDSRDLSNWLEKLEMDNVVVTYHPDVPPGTARPGDKGGFAYVARRETDQDVIRPPDQSDLY